MFLFQIGSIRRRRHGTCLSGSPSRFYSRLVRLEVDSLQVLIDLRTKFLFQIGSIRSHDLYDMVPYNAKVSIPDWFD